MYDQIKSKQTYNMYPRFLLLLLGICVTNALLAQTAKPVLAVMPFVTTDVKHKPIALRIQEQAIQVLLSKTGIKVVDRTKDAAVIKELDNQIREYSIQSKTLAKQGVLAGAQQVLVGTLTGVSVDIKEGNQLLGTSKKYVCYLSYSIQIIDVATGTTLYTQLFDGSTKKKDILGDVIGGKGDAGKVAGNAMIASSETEATNNAVNASKKDMAQWFSKLFPTVVRLIEISKKSKKGSPESVLVTGVDINLNKGSLLNVSQETFIDDGTGKKLRRLQKIIQLKIEAFEGEVTSCRIVEGGALVEENLKKELYVLVE